MKYIDSKLNGALWMHPKKRQRHGRYDAFNTVVCIAPFDALPADVMDLFPGEGEPKHVTIGKYVRLSGTPFQGRLMAAAEKAHGRLRWGTTKVADFGIRGKHRCIAGYDDAGRIRAMVAPWLGGTR